MITLYNEKDEKLKLISVFEFNDADMGESSISATVSFDKEQDFHPDWYVVYNGEKFRLGVRKPTGKKDTSSFSTTYTLVFKSEREDLKRYTFMDFVELGTGNPQPSSYNVSLYATLSELVDRFNTNLRYYMGSRWQMVLPADYVEDGNAISIAFDNASLWDVLLRFYEIHGVRWVIRSAGDTLQIQVGFQEVEIEHVFEYGKDNGLVSVERNNALERTITRLRGRGSEKNLPPDYFHTGDPDTNSFLQATYFKNLMPKAYRDYIRGYNAGSGTGSWAYNQGVSDRVSGRNISPVDYAISDKEDLWGISYGAIEPNEQIYPTLQGATRNGVRLDEVLAVEKVLVNGVREPQNIVTIGLDAGAEETRVAKCGEGGTGTVRNMPNCWDGIDDHFLYSQRFGITNPINTLHARITLVPSYIDDDGLDVSTEFGDKFHHTTVLKLIDYSNNHTTGEVIQTHTITDVETYEWVLQDIPVSDEYRIRAEIYWKAQITRYDIDPDRWYWDPKEEEEPNWPPVVVVLNARLTGAMVDEYALAEDKGEWKETFDIEIRDVWGITRNEGESDEDYTYRVWEPRAVSEDMTVMFSDGLLAGEDYEFSIVGFNSDANDLRQTIITAIKPTSDGGWKLTLQKSDAELEAGNIYLPNTQQNAKPGDHFFFVNISMPYDPYVYDAEARLLAYLDEQLALKDEEFPSFTITPSRIFCSSFAEADKIQAGAKIRVRNTALVGSSYISLYIQSLTKRYSGNSLNPEWNLTLSDLVVASGNPVETLEGQVDILTQRVYSNRSAVQEAVRSLSSTFLRKDGIADTSYSPTEFKKRVELGEGISDKGFRVGDIQGQGFGVYTDADGNRVVEADILVGRIGARFNEAIINQVTYSAGKQVFSAAGMVVDRVEDTGTGWRCYLDPKNGTERNYFAVNDGAFSQRFTDAGIRQYWARVIAVGADWIEISKTDRMQGSFDPIAGDNIAQLGNSTDKSRQAALIIDETHDGGGLVTWFDDITDFTLSNKDSVNIGRVNGKTWLQVYGSGYIGDREQTQYVKYENGVLQIRGRLEVGTKLSDGRDLEQAIKDATPEGYEEFVESVIGDIDDIKVSVGGVEKSIEEIQKELDGAIETWFYEGVPTLANAPASDWTTDELKNIHLGDLYYDGVTGKAYRFQMDGSVYIWREITDTDIQAALEAASKAQDTADRKRRVFIEQPTPPYDEGDLWAGGKSEPLRRCIVARASGLFNAEDWDYADSTQEQLAGYEYLKRALGESTTVEGGLIQSSLLMLGYTDSDKVFHIMSGTNGLYDATKKGGGIAAWYGGPMADKEADSALVEYAQSLFRFDGSGYLAGGKISWDKDGAGKVADGGLSWDKNGVITLGTSIKISGDTDETLGSILDYLNEILSFIGLDDNGDVYIKPNGDTPRNFYSHGEVSSFGLGTEGDGTGGVTALAALDDVNVSNPTDGQSLVYDLASDKWVNKTVSGGISQVTIKLGTASYDSVNGVVALPAYPTTLKNPYALTWSGHSSGSYDGSSAVNIAIPTSLPASDVYAWAKAATKPSYAFSEITSKPTTLAGYGITDALSVNGGTINNTTTSPLVLNSTHSSGQSILTFRNNGKNKATVGYADNNYGVWLYNFNGGNYLGVKNDGTPHYNGNTLYHTGNFNPADYLPKSGGTLTNSLAVSAGTISSTRTSTRRAVFYKNASASMDAGTYIIDVSDSGDAVLKLTYDNLTWKDNSIIHSGNIGSQSVNSAIKLYFIGYVPSSGFDANTALSGGGRMSNYSSASYWGSSMPPTMSYGTICQLQGHEGSNSLAGQIAWDINHANTTDTTRNLWWRANDTSGFSNAKWHQIAFTDSNVASATKLQTAINIYGNLFDGTQDLSKARPFLKSSSASDLITREAESITIGTSTSSRVGYSSGIGFNALAGCGSYDAHTHAWIGLNGYVSGADAETYNLVFATNNNTTKGASPTERMRITPSGNVLIGTTTDNGSKLQVEGDVRIDRQMTADDWNAIKLYNRGSWSIYSGHIAGVGVYDEQGVVGRFGITYKGGVGQFVVKGLYNSGYDMSEDIFVVKGNGEVYVTGNFIATGEVSSGSDARYKAIQSYVDIDIKTIANAPIINFKWNDREDDKVHLGSTAQYWYGTSLCKGVTPTNDEKLWTMGYGQIALASVVSVAKKVVNHEERLQIVEKELADYKAENKELKLKLERYGIQ